MTTIGKCLAVVTTVACLAFLGFVWAVLAGGPNWQAMAEELEDYSFELSEGENPTWTARHRVTGEQIGSDPLLPKLVVQAREHMKQSQDRTLQGENNRPGLGDEIAQWEARISEARELNAADRQALVAHEQQLAELLDEVRAAVEDTSNQIVQKTQEVQAVQVLAERRREEVYRLRHQVEEIQADLYRIVAQNKKLADLVRRGAGQLQRVLRRQEQLIEGGAQDPYDEPVAVEAPPGPRRAALVEESPR